MKPTFLATLTVMTIAGASASFAQHRGGPAFDFSAIDADANGEITQAEITAFQAARFAAADTDSDGQLTLEEMTAQMASTGDRGTSARAAKRLEKMLAHLDTDDSGTLSLEERQNTERTARMFERLDRDDSGTISAQEAEKLAQRGRGGDHKKAKRGS